MTRDQWVPFVLAGKQINGWNLRKSIGNDFDFSPEQCDRFLFPALRAHRGDDPRAMAFQAQIVCFGAEQVFLFSAVRLMANKTPLLKHGPVEMLFRRSRFREIRMAGKTSAHRPLAKQAG